MATNFSENTPPGYPVEYEAWFTARDGRRVFLRPIKPEDRELLVDLLHRVSERTIFLRFLGHLRELSPDLLDHFTIVNYVSDFALVATVVENGENHIISVSRYHYDNDTGGTEFAVAVRDDWQGMGLGKEMVRRLFEAAKKNGLRRIEAVMDSSNETITKILKSLNLRYSSKPLRGLYELSVEL
jgi:acetyltransferase